MKKYVLKTSITKPNYGLSFYEIDLPEALNGRGLEILINLFVDGNLLRPSSAPPNISKILSRAGYWSFLDLSISDTTIKVTPNQALDGDLTAVLFDLVED